MRRNFGEFSFKLFSCEFMMYEAVLVVCLHIDAVLSTTGILCGFWKLSRNFHFVSVEVPIVGRHSAILCFSEARIWILVLRIYFSQLHRFVFVLFTLVYLAQHREFSLNSLGGRFIGYLLYDFFDEPESLWSIGLLFQIQTILRFSALSLALDSSSQAM